MSTPSRPGPAAPSTSTAATPPTGTGSTRPSARSRPTPTAPPTPTCCASRCRATWGIDLYLKDESTHPTGTLKHRLARSLFLYALCNGWIRPGTPGHRGVQRLHRGLRGVLRPAARPAVHRGDAAHAPSREKIALIEFHGGRCHLVDDPRDGLRRGRRAGRGDRRPLHGPVHLRRAGHRLARQQQHRRVDLRQLALERHPVPGLDRRRRRHRRHLRDHRPLRPLPQHDTRLCVVDPENSALLRRLGRRRPGRHRATAAPASRASAGRGWSRASCPA